jgi:hypothetical protein
MSGWSTQENAIVLRMRCQHVDTSFDQLRKEMHACTVLKFGWKSATQRSLTEGPIIGGPIVAVVTGENVFPGENVFWIVPYIVSGTVP